MEGQRPGDVDLIAERQPADNDVLRHLVSRERGDGNRREGYPLNQAGSETPFGGGDRCQTVGGRADSNVWAS